MFKAIQIPAPLGNRPARGENSDEPKRIHAGEWQFRKSSFNPDGGVLRERCPHDYTATDHFSRDSFGDGIPIDQREGSAGVVDPDPCAPVRFRRTEYGSSSEPEPRRGQSRHAGQLLVAAHAEGVAVSSS